MNLPLFPLNYFYGVWLRFSIEIVSHSKIATVRIPIKFSLLKNYCSKIYIGFFLLSREQLIKMKVLVPVKRVVDYAVKIRVTGGKVETNNVKVYPFD
jgi:hypothetical protein